MANKPIIGNVTVSSTAKTLSGGRLNIGGVWKTVVESYECINGVWKPSWKRSYTWGKYTVENVMGYSVEFSSTSKSLSMTATSYTMAKSYSTDTNGNPVLAGGTTTASGRQISTMYSAYPYVIINGVLYKIISAMYTGSGTAATVYEATVSSYVVTVERGTYIEDVTAETENAYPANGIHTDGFWYVFQG